MNLSFSFSFWVVSLFLLCSGSYAKPIIGNDAGDFVFEYSIGGHTKKITVYYFSPQTLLPKSRIVFVLHGAGRDGKSYRDVWRQYAAKYNFLVLCPEFSEYEFPGWWNYNGGNIYSKEKKQFPPRQDWTFNVIEGLFDFVKKDRQMKAEAYCIFGHSAGAQFVQRMVLFMPEARFSLAIANGAGDYTEPVFDKNFSNGLKGTIVNEDSLRKSFAKNMIILVGERDLVSKTMPKNPADFNEYDRLWMAKRFHETSKAESQKRGVTLNWRFALVPNADHNSLIHADYGSRLAASSRIFISNPTTNEPNAIKVNYASQHSDGNDRPPN